MVTVRQALQAVADGRLEKSDDMLVTPVHQLISETLFVIANTPDAKKRGSLARATKAQKMIANRLVGKRRAGTHPAQDLETKIDFVDLTIGVLDA